MNQKKENVILSQLCMGTKLLSDVGVCVAWFWCKIWTKGRWYFLLVALYYCKIKQKIRHIDLTEGYFLSLKDVEMKKLRYWADLWPPSPSHLESQGWAVSITFFMVHGGHFRWFSRLKVSSLMVVEFKKWQTYTWGAWPKGKNVTLFGKKENDNISLGFSESC